MGFYNQVVLPWLLDAAMRDKRLVPYRQRVVGAAEGRVLEIGPGAGANLPFYSDRTTELLGLEPHSKLRAMAAEAGLRVMEGSAEAIPMENESIDTVLTTWTLCSIPGVDAALREMRRVLKPTGRLLFVEHGLAPDAGVRQWQHRLDPLWTHIAGGCHMDRDIPALLLAGGFEIERMETGYLPGPRVLTFQYEGSALCR